MQKTTQSKGTSVHPRSSGRRKVSRLARMLTLVLLSLCMSAIALSFCLRLIVFSGENDVTRSAQLDNVAKFAITHLIIAANNNDITELQRRLDQLAVANNLDFTKLTLNPAHASNPSDSGTGVPLSLAATGSVNQNQNLPMASRHSYGFSYGGGTANLEISVNEHYMSSTTDKTITHLFKHFLLDVIVIALLTITFAYSMRRLLLRHIIHMSDYITTADYDDFTHNLTLERRIATAENRDELDDVADAYESMRSALVSQTEKRRVVERALKEEKQQKQEIRRLIENAKNANKAKSEFIATMSHEIRTPLNGVVGMVEMLRDTPLNNNQKHYLDVLYRSGESLLEIINDILDYSKIESGKMLLEKIEFNIEELISNCFKLFVATAGKRDIELFSDISPDIPTHLIGDPTRLRQIVVNLVGNAFKFTSNGYVIVRVRLDSKNTGDKVKLLFSICDSGIGISREDQAHLFQAFRQADTSTTRKFGGSGLGLAICKQLVDLMGGDIGISSTPGEGSIFWFTSEFSADLKELYKNPLSCSLALSGKLLLTLNLSRALQEALSFHCPSWNLQLENANSFNQIHARAIKEKKPIFDFILINHLPDENDGFEIAKKFRDIAAYRSTPILMLTNQQGSSFSQSQMYSVTTIVPRPISVRNLDQIIISQGYGTQLNPLMPAAPERESHAQLKVLVAEDNAVNRMVIEGLLSKFDIVPEFAENGLEAVNKVFTAKSPYDLIIMDCEMPELDGFGATERIREEEKNRGVHATPIIALTAHVEASHRQRVFDSGMNHFLSKPVTINKLGEALKNIGLNSPLN